jgi:hypothetical protein
LGAAFDDKSFQSGRGVAQGGVAVLDDVLELLVGVASEEGRALERPADVLTIPARSISGATSSPPTTTWHTPSSSIGWSIRRERRTSNTSGLQEVLRLGTIPESPKIAAGIVQKISPHQKNYN